MSQVFNSMFLISMAKGMKSLKRIKIDILIFDILFQNLKWVKYHYFFHEENS